ncbi:hypothetical protein Tsubulata_030360 [Turnera subulata]|uniref:Uncharacterized protein n=1 Tax=Turnera subulata TaxID=218843 RepID=A0A9Q0G742_9ROSI|nr:hypothetical protein Tsubulata_030360 [Turnera subulata]
MGDGFYLEQGMGTEMREQEGQQTLEAEVIVGVILLAEQIVETGEGNLGRFWNCGGDGGNGGLTRWEAMTLEVWLYLENCLYEMRVAIQSSSHPFITIPARALKCRPPFLSLTSLSHHRRPVSPPRPPAAFFPTDEPRRHLPETNTHLPPPTAAVPSSTPSLTSPRDRAAASPTRPPPLFSTLEPPSSLLLPSSPMAGTSG